MTKTDTKRTDSGGLMSSIAAVRELLMVDSSSHDALEEELSAVKKAHYEERLLFEREVQQMKDLVADLQTQLKDSKQEVRIERFLRKSLEETNEALDEHKRQLTEQLEEVSKSRGSLEGSLRKVRITMGVEKANILREKDELEGKLQEAIRQKNDAHRRIGEWEARYLTSQRETEELKASLEVFNHQVEDSRARQQEILHDHKGTYESFRKRLESSAAARKKAEEDLRAIEKKSSDENQSSATSADSSSQTKLLKAQKLKLQNQLKEKSMQHRSEIQKYIDLLESLKSQLKEAEDGRKDARQKLQMAEFKMESMRRLMSEEELEQEREIQKQLTQKIESLKQSFGKMCQTLSRLRLEIEAAAGTALAAKKEKELELETAKVGATLETMQAEIQEKLKIARAKADRISQDLAAVRDTWRVAREEEIAVQAELKNCQSRIADLQNSLQGNSERGEGTASVEFDHMSPVKRGKVDDADNPLEAKRRKQN